MTAVSCNACKRPNAAGALVCIWCRAELIEGMAPPALEAMTVEAFYLGGLARIDDPTLVRLTISPQFFEIAESVPGTRCVRISKNEIVEAKIARSVIGRSQQAQSWWKSALDTLKSSPGRKEESAAEMDFVISIRYVSEGEMLTALFRCLNRNDQLVAQKLKRILIKLTNTTPASTEFSRG